MTDRALAAARANGIRLTPEQSYERLILLEGVLAAREKHEAVAKARCAKRIKCPLFLRFQQQEKVLVLPGNVADKVFMAASGGTPVIEDGWRESKVKHQEAALEALLQPLIDAGVISINY